MCIVVHMIATNVGRENIDEYQDLLGVVTASGRSLVKADRRVQLKMPSVLVKMLDREFPGVSRSDLLTQMAAEVIIRKKRIADPTLEGWVSEEQYDLDRMWSYLDGREKNGV